MTRETHHTANPPKGLVRPALKARSAFSLQRYRRALLQRGPGFMGVLALPRRDPARDRAARIVFGSAAR
ncbi:hypothetical protein OB2597_13838 [Pseudooceanicola batsensis HTCC2597]|uniref:Uncharacterized protein n=1 Tax=Pseudooceanicola batsensis (strain ATCC BAA-863 / DSM 15984 / KCTC 12145 / HTCC2597) TaxID=252305 RepID=A3TYJ6_PSEBH|nr:hypothetical protein [Pseudooceanicola batsensis]EAQ03230.1 hypothetical protein OB2597_13838 [Pseudooceanicola batsensis HTCC2597]